MSAPDPLAPTHDFALAVFARKYLAPPFRRLFKAKIHGTHNVPDGPVIFAGNHISYADPMILWASASRPVHFMAKSTLWKNPVLAWGLSRLWAFPVDRDKPDRTAIQIAETLLKRGDTVGIFPEGTRNLSGTADAQLGVAFIALRAGVPIVPVAIVGTEKIRPRGVRTIRFPQITIAFGPPIEPGDFTAASRKEQMAMITSAVMEGIESQVAKVREGSLEEGSAR